MAIRSKIMPHPVIGHVHLRVTNLDRSIAFYQNALGLDLIQRYGTGAAFLSWGGYHHHIGLNTWHSKNGGPAPDTSAGLYHLAILYPTRSDLANALKKLIDNGVHIDGASDHGVSEAIYFRDPDGNGIEIYWDKPREAWPTQNGELQMVTEPLELSELLQIAQ